MNLPQGQTDGTNWHEHTELVKKYSGTMKAYCRLHNLNYDKFMYYRGRAINSQKKMIPAGFAKVQPVDLPMASVPASPAVVAKPNNYPQMPDAKWLAELIHNLVGFK